MHLNARLVIKIIIVCEEDACIHQTVSSDLYNILYDTYQANFMFAPLLVIFSLQFCGYTARGDVNKN